MILKRKASSIDNQLKMKKEVRFDDVVRVGLFEKASPQKAKHIWYRKSDIAAFKVECRRIVLSYRELRKNNGQQQQQNQQQQSSDLSTYRGFEYYSSGRKKQKVIANRCVIWAQKKGMTATDIATIYWKMNYKSSDVAFIQGIHDYNDVYDRNTASTSQQVLLPVASSMIPSPPSPPTPQPPFIFAMNEMVYSST